MSDPQSETGVADREAAEWHVRLGERPVSAATLQAFKTWRETPANADAYRRVETLWRTTGSLRADADIRALTQETLRTSRPRTGRFWIRRGLPAVAVGISVLVAAVALFLWLPTRNLYSTEVGGQRLVRLGDGTRIQLDTNTRLRIRYRSAERRVILEQGQALFTVASDAARPFRVAAGETEVTALGTVFDVRREAVGVRVTLVEGAVAVSEGASAEARRWRLTAGQQVRTSRTNPAPRRVDPEVETSWSEGRLVFRNAPLRDAVAEVNRYLPDKIVLAAEAAAEVPVNGVFASGDRDAFVSAVSDLFGLSVHPEADGGVRLGAPSAGG
ncbi:FecR domain-containing protein [Brevundimonas sp. PAMC22021]|uniref:FecR family protein n=1 Tax=Brevundimonas sp. PAMC22021 TaxID=2861285 RepID=UPI001C626DA1|nr:FecR domain-containing protein [Brevundimonas sp. PAMC22021]QYF87057.1 FecR domain-containing protein [Brevundimonas sp. PAMC22021]